MPSPRCLRRLLMCAVCGAPGCKESTSIVVPPPLDAPLASVSAGVLHTCGVTISNRIYCWGWNRDGELGNGLTTDSRYPQRVSGAWSFAAATAGGGHSCGVTTSGTAYCWGFNLTGQLGDGSSASRSTPGAVSSGLTFTTLDAGGAFTCGVGADSTGYCWGWGGSSQLGAQPPDTCTTSGGPAPCSLRPIAIAGRKFLAISAGTEHACGLAADSSAYCWGRNDFGQLGDSSTSLRVAPVAVVGGLKFKLVAVGYQHSCGLTAGGAAFCWGDNAVGQLGDSLVSSSSAPNPVATSLTFASLSAGATYNCAVTAVGAGYCWGNDQNGQLGSLSTDFCVSAAGGVPCARTPAAVAGGLVLTAISAGTQHTCGMTAERVAFCWGLNDRGQLGSGASAGSVAPVRVANQP